MAADTRACLIAVSVILSGPRAVHSRFARWIRGCRHREDDPFYCPWNPKTQSQTPRAITFNISCNLSMPFGARTFLVDAFAYLFRVGLALV